MIRGLAVAASVLLLAGCAAPVMPAPMTPAEMEERQAEDQAAWWDSIFPDEPQPIIDPIEYVNPETANYAVTECMKDAALPDVQFGSGGFTVTSTEKAANDAANRQYFICNALYPVSPTEVGYLSDAELEYIYYYNRDRLVPCLQLLGYPAVNRTSDYVKGSNEFWSPYYEMMPLPTEEEWDRIDLRCPPSPVGPDWHPSTD